jgi:hypothetical protein
MTVWSSESPAGEEGDAERGVLVGGIGVDIEAEGGEAPAGPADGDR